MPTSRATRVTSAAKAFSWSTIVLMVSFSCQISPRTSTVILRDRSPLAMAVATSAMLRTWPVRLLAIEFTLSVRSFQVPPAPGTSAWPPSLPSVPTSRATRVTSDANERSWSTMVFMVSFSCRISPRTSTVILRDRSPLAMAVATSAMLRTCAVRLPAIEFTLSVRSFQVPATPGTVAWPPSLPSVPTSRATRVTSAEKPFSWSTMVLMVFFSARISPFTSTVILRDRSPRATAVVTSAMLRTWPVRLVAIALTESVRSFHVPATPGTSAWPPSLPSVPTSRATRVTSDANERSWSTIVLMASFSCWISPRTSTVILRDRSPLATAMVTSEMLRTWPVRLLAMELTPSVRSFHTPLTSFTTAWPPSLPSVPTSRATRVTSAEKPFSWSTMVLMVFFSARISPFTSTVILRDRSPRATAVVTSAMLRTWPVRLVAIALTESVRSFHVPATPGTSAWPPSLPSVPTSRATRVTSDANERSWSTMVLMASFSCWISPRTFTVILRDRSPLAMAVATSAMLRTWPVRLPAMELTLSVRSFQVPAAPGNHGLAAELAFRAHFARHAGHFGGETAHLFDHGIDDGRGAQELTLDRAALDLKAHELGKIALGHRRNGAGGFRRGPEKVVDEGVEGTLHFAPGAGTALCRDTVPRPAILAHQLARTLDFPCKPLLAAAMSLTTSATLPDRPLLSPGSLIEKSPSRMPCRTFSSRRTSSSESSTSTCETDRDERRLIRTGASITTPAQNWQTFPLGRAYHRDRAGLHPAFFLGL